MYIRYGCVNDTTVDLIVRDERLIALQPIRITVTFNIVKQHYFDWVICTFAHSLRVNYLMILCT